MAHFGGSVADSLYKFRLRASLALLSFARWHCYRADMVLLKEVIYSMLQRA